MNPYSIPEYIRNLAPYVPGKPIEETQREFGLKKVYKLASNENPMGPSPRATRFIREQLGELHRYPDASGFLLKEALGKHLKVKPEELILGNGSNEVIDFLIRTYCVAGDTIATPKLSFVAYKICAQIHGVRNVEGELTDDLRADLVSLLHKIKSEEKIKIVFIANPNNPTGTYNTTAEIKSFLKDVSQVRGGSVLVVLDYAYWEYVTAKDLPDPHVLQKEFKNVVVLRTFSKVYGLAGLRVGYGVGDPTLLSALEKVRMPFNLNSLALCGAVEALKDQEFVKRAVKTNKEGLLLWEKSLDKMKVPYWPSQGNFILIDAKKGFGRSGVELFQSCLKRGVIFRPVANYGLHDALRISIGSSVENRIAIRTLEAEKSS